MAAAPHQIVIIGASFAGLAAAHGLLKKVLPPLTTEGKTFKVVQIAPNEEFFWKIGAPRVVVNPESLPLEKALIPLAPAFAQYKPEQYQFIKAYATSINPATKTVSTDSSEPVHYDSLIIASGTSFPTDIWSVSNGTDALKSAMKDIHDRLPKAESILIAGGGPVGVETAGELAHTYGGKKDITFLSGSTGLLNNLNNKKMGQDAAARLESKGVKVIHDNLKVVEHTHANGKDVLKLSNGETKTVDVYINATGDRPNTKFVPQEWLDDKQRVKTNPQTLRLDVPGVTGVYVYGAVGSYSSGVMIDIMFAATAFLESLKNDLSGQGQEPSPRTKNVYKRITSDMMIVPVGPQGGVGIAFGWRLPSFLVKLAKSRDFMIGRAAGAVDGTA